eukprot:TRINITY_DN3964_c0_g1_i1.p1 TRINITY_DN3964_c0_g1~~TRINITY_DN3964_c0_g1_i1.p1  ORF type:complete len:462 (+),score=86.24 TRINITY_DN3964_c0_g1_i1:102-1487(+)
MVKITRGGLALLGGSALVSTSFLAVYFQMLQDLSVPSANGMVTVMHVRKQLRNQLNELEMAAEAVHRKLPDQEGESKERDLHAAVPRKAIAMMESHVVLPAALGRSFVEDMFNGFAKQSSTEPLSWPWYAIDKNQSTFAQTQKLPWSWWEYQSNERLKVTGVQLTLGSQGGDFQYSLHITVDGQFCGILSQFVEFTKQFVQCITPLYGHDVRLQDLSGWSTYVQVYEVRIEEERSGRDDVTEADVRATICPWAGTMLNMEKLRGCTQTKETLMRVAVASGLPERLARRVVEENFQNYPSEEQNLCDMEGSLNEHINSTKCNDCPTSYLQCTQRHGETPAFCESIETKDKDCGKPSAEAFDEFFAKIKADDPSPYLSCAELEQNAHLVPVTDTNNVGLGSIAGSHCLLLVVFGENVTVDASGEHIQAFIHRDNLREVILQRIFPSNGYKYGVRREWGAPGAQ